MASLLVFNQITLDGYFTGPGGDLSWAKEHPADAEFQAFVAGNAKGGGVLLFGRITYDMMAGWWPTPQAIKSMPEVANQMNALPKVVFSRTMEKASWNNTRVVKADIVAEIRRMKQAPGPDMVLMGSGTIVAQLAAEGVIDEYQFVVFPIVLGKGRTMFEGVSRKLGMKLRSTRSFGNGIVLLNYIPGL
jgi:dihydrofolate reductase